MNRKSVTSAGASRHTLESQSLLGFTIWITPFRGVTPVQLATFQRRLENYLSERSSLPVVLAQFGDLCVVPIAWLYNASRLKADQVIEMQGGYRSTATLH
jgi:hypothetical protein